MLNTISDKLTSVLGSLRGKRLTEDNVESAIRDIRMALIESDVNIHVIKSFIARVKEQALGERVTKDVNAHQMFIKIIHDELVNFLGGARVDIALREPTRVTNVLLLGLQGSGKTTTAGKLAQRLKKERDILLVSLDIHRPSANEQLKKLSERTGVAFFDRGEEKDIRKIIKEANAYAKKHVHNLIIWDSAGRTHMDDELLKELKDIYKEIDVHESLLVCDSMLGQRAAEIAKGFKDTVPISGLIFTKFDSQTKGGAVLSVKEMVQVPIKYIGMGETIDDLDYFDASRIADRMLGMGDIVGLVEKAQNLMDEESAKKLQEKMSKQEFDLQDFYDQIKQMGKLGSMSSIMSMIPGMNSNMLASVDEKKFQKITYIIDSMTIKEKTKPFLINGSRKVRIAKGSGTTVAEVAGLLKQYDQMKQMMKKMGVENIDFSTLENKFHDKLGE